MKFLTVLRLFSILIFAKSSVGIAQQYSLIPNSSWSTSLLCMTATYADEPNSSRAANIVRARSESCNSNFSAEKTNAYISTDSLEPDQKWSAVLLCSAVAYSDMARSERALRILQRKNEKCDSILTGVNRPGFRGGQLV
jgi:hypothetical protein